MAQLKDLLVLGPSRFLGNIYGTLKGNADTATNADTLDGVHLNGIAAAKSTTLAWGTQSTIATIGGNNINITLPANPNTNTWRGIQNNLTSDSTTDSLSAAQGKWLYNNKLGAKSANGYWGMAAPDTSDNVWIRTTSLGIIPYQSGAAGSGHGGIGTSTWYFANAYIDNVHGSLDGNAATATKATQDSDGNQINTTYLKKNSMANTEVKSVTSGTTAGTASILRLYGPTYGNDASYLKTAGKFSFGDPGPQIQFGSSASGGQQGALIFTDHDTIGSGVSLSFVTNEPDAYFIATHIKALSGFVGNLSGNASTATSADTVDGYHASSLWRSDGATWNPGANVSLSATANNQEWSFDINRNGKTGCYWHVWDSSLSTMLKVNADDGKVSAPYGFVGNVAGNVTGSSGSCTGNAATATRANITTTAKAIARYSDTAGTFANSSVLLQDNGRIDAVAGNGIGIKIGAANITAASTTNGEIVLQGGHLRFGDSAWDYDKWAGLKYNSTNKTVYLGIADNNAFNANSTQTFGKLCLPRINYIENGIAGIGNARNYKIVSTYTNEGTHLTTNSWFKIANVSDYFNFNINITGGWSTGAPSVARVNICNRNGTVFITQLSGFSGSLSTTIRLGKVSTDSWDVLVLHNGFSSGTRSAQHYTFTGVGNITVYQPSGADGTSYTTVKDLNLTSIDGNLLSSGNYTDYTVTKAGAGATGTWPISINGSSASCTGNAATATNATNHIADKGNPHGVTKSQVGLGNVTNYDQSKAIKSITRSGTTFTYTCLDGSTGTFTQQDNNTTYSTVSKTAAGLAPQLPNETTTTKYLRQDGTWAVPPDNNTTYSAEKGITLASGKFGHSNTAITAGSVGSAQSPSHGGTFAIPKITYDAYGHITAATTVNITLPADNNTDTKVNQSVTTTDNWRKVLLHHTSAAADADVATETDVVYAAKGIEVQPSTGTFKANTIKIASTSSAKHLEFSRGDYNYITTPAGGRIAFIVGGESLSAANAKMVITDSGNIYPGTDNTGSMGTSNHKWGTIYGTKVYGAVWNDYAEYRNQKEKVEPGYVVIEQDNGKLVKSTARLQKGGAIVSDTFGFAIGETDENKTPLAVSGRVLAYTYEPREMFHAGDAVCTGPDGKVSLMTEEEEERYPLRCIGIVSEIPDYEIWGTGNTKVNNRIWIKVK